MLKDVYSSEMEIEEISFASILGVNFPGTQLRLNNGNTAPLEVGIPGCPIELLLF